MLLRQLLAVKALDLEPKNQVNQQLELELAQVALDVLVQAVGLDAEKVLLRKYLFLALVLL